MTLQNVRSLLWRGEDLGSGGGNTRELTVPTQVVAAQRPTISTRAFVGSVDISSLVSIALVSGAYSTLGRNRLIVNRSSAFWLTVSGTQYAGAPGVGTLASFPIAPMQTFFLPQNFGGTVVVTANNAWPAVVPLSGQTTATVPLAQVTNALTIDVIVEG